MKVDGGNWEREWGGGGGGVELGVSVLCVGDEAWKEMSLS